MGPAQYKGKMERHPNDQRATYKSLNFEMGVIGAQNSGGGSLV